ncbi:MAG: CBS domain-containing protein [bacterium]|nr:CBS domain-containing protein [bacterium]
MNETSRIKELMSTDVVSVAPETLLTEADALLRKRAFSGLPVVDTEGKLVGMFTEFDLSTKGSLLHLPTILKLFKEFSIYQKDKGLVWKDVSSMLAIKVEDIMNTMPFTVNQNISLKEVVKLFSERRRVDPLPIVDDDQKLVGIVSRYDLIRYFGGLPVSFRDPSPYTLRDVDRRIDNFLRNFEKQFVAVSKYRTLHWFLISVTFTFVGFFAALAVLIRIE